MWSLIASGKTDDLKQWIDHAPSIVKMRSEDGRGPLWWAYEYDRPDMVHLLVENGADLDATDALGMVPKEMQA